MAGCPIHAASHFARQTDQIAIARWRSSAELPTGTTIVRCFAKVSVNNARTQGELDRFRQEFLERFTNASTPNELTHLGESRLAHFAPMSWGFANPERRRLFSAMSVTLSLASVGEAEVSALMTRAVPIVALAAIPSEGKQKRIRRSEPLERELPMQSLGIMRATTAHHCPSGDTWGFSKAPPLRELYRGRNLVFIDVPPGGHGGDGPFPDGDLRVNLHRVRSAVVMGAGIVWVRRGLSNFDLRGLDGCLGFFGGAFDAMSASSVVFILPPSHYV